MNTINRSIEILREEGVASFINLAGTHILNRIRPVWYGLGSGRECSICGWKGSRFLPFGVENRPDAKCPHCSSKERHRLIWEYFSQEYMFEGSIDLLYFAPNKALEQRMRNKDSITVTTTDLMQEGVNVKADITELPFDDISFDIIICSHVLEHVPSDTIALKELYRVLRTGGEAIILVPQNRDRDKTYEDPSITTEEGREEAFGQSDHVRWYGRDVQEIISSAGFDVSIIDYIEQLDESYINRHRLRESDKWIHSPTRIFRCPKRTE
ncbi:class I SAM-dependent methyltransferase [Natrinema caseinilyticum]|uniref:class I SAM-dependent methyltransferase n=1 Tax=Natrinema caseinilyticum TaxID=2961570 RepID=UPI0020C225C5|nr:class I SAM-dependent methyltransferase [Natrinema caseinilyticum]